MEDKYYKNNDRNISRFSTNNTISQINFQNAPSNFDNRPNNQNYYNYAPSMFDLMNQMNNMTNMINQMKNHIQMQNITNKNYQTQMYKVLTENEKMKNDLQLMKSFNLKMEKQYAQLEKKCFKMKMNNDQMKKHNDQMKKNNDQMKKQIESLNQKLDSVNSNLIDRLDNIEIKMKEFKEIENQIILNIQQDGNLMQQINQILKFLDIIISDTRLMKSYMNETIKENKEEILKLKKEVDILKERIKELQEIIIGRKIIKIILKTIIINCFESYSLIKQNKKYQVVNVKLKNSKYGDMINVVNNLIDGIFKANKIIHIDGAINKIVDIINNNTTYGDSNIIKKK